MSIEDLQLVSMDDIGDSVEVFDQNDLVQDAWGRPKAIMDYSLFHGVWTYDVPNRIWEESSVDATGAWTPIASTGTNVVSTDGMLHVYSGTTANQGNVCSSKRHPRYQPNRGHLYSTAVILPNATANGIRRFGLFNEENGFYFELEGDGVSWELYAVRKSAGVVQSRVAVNYDSSYDPEKGHVYDVQYQWRGLGNSKYYIDLALVHTESILGTLTALSVQNPALPVSFESVLNASDSSEIVIQAGCVDVTSEGGGQEGRTFLSVNTGATLVQADTTGRAILAVKVPRTVFKDSVTSINTRDAIFSKVASWCRDEAALQIYGSRDTLVPNLDGLTWTDINDSHIQYLVGGEGSALDNAFQTDRTSMELLVNEWQDIEVKNEITNPAENSAPYHGTPGDIIVVCIQTIQVDKQCAATFYMSEEI